jgi:60 kDa SS-A/Ro ribonucleoprotein
MGRYTGVFSKRQTPQSQPIPGSSQVRNSAGGFTWAINDFARLDRFLVLGSDTPTYYATAQALSRENAECVVRCIAADGARTVARIVEVSDEGRAPKNSPAIFALALCAALGDSATRQAALAALPRVCRIGTHLFEFVEYHQGLRGWSRSLRRAIGDWYNQLSPRDLAYQAIKYQQREGWAHRDLLCLAHPKPADESRQIVYHWIVEGWPGIGLEPHPDPNVVQIWAMEKARRTTDAREVAALIREYRLPREAVPTRFLTDPAVWDALLDDMPMTAMLRNLGTMSKVGLLTDGSEAETTVLSRIGDADRLRHARIHPIAILAALKVYGQGHGARSSATWTPCRRVVDALDAAFYTSFRNVEPTGKRHLLALDVSGSMTAGAIAGIPGLTPRVASAALALVTMNVETDCEVVGFTAKSGASAWHDSAITKLKISPRQRLDDVIAYVDGLPFGGTDCALPMIFARKRKLAVDTFVVLTDNETWAGKIHPAQALREYREASGIAARCAVVGMTATSFSIADPNDPGMLDCVGFDTATPQLIADFAGGRL